MTSRAQRVFQEAMELSEPERMDLAEQLVASVPPDSEWTEELERRAQRAFDEPDSAFLGRSPENGSQLASSGDDQIPPHRR